MGIDPLKLGLNDFETKLFNNLKQYGLETMQGEGSGTWATQVVFDSSKTNPSLFEGAGSNRIAVTGDSPSNVYIDVEKIGNLNSPTLMKLLIHEFAHHTGVKDDPNRKLDAFAEKVFAQIDAEDVKPTGEGRAPEFEYFEALRIDIGETNSAIAYPMTSDTQVLISDGRQSVDLLLLFVQIISMNPDFKFTINDLDVANLKWDFKNMDGTMHFVADVDLHQTSGVFRKLQTQLFIPLKKVEDVRRGDRYIFPKEPHKHAQFGIDMKEADSWLTWLRERAYPSTPNAYADDLNLKLHGDTMHAEGQFNMPFAYDSLGDLEWEPLFHRKVDNPNTGSQSRTPIKLSNEYLSKLGAPSVEEVGSCDLRFSWPLVEITETGLIFDTVLSGFMIRNTKTGHEFLLIPNKFQNLSEVFLSGPNEPPLIPARNILAHELNFRSTKKTSITDPEHIFVSDIGMKMDVMMAVKTVPDELRDLQNIDSITPIFLNGWRNTSETGAEVNLASFFVLAKDANGKNQLKWVPHNGVYYLMGTFTTNPEVSIKVSDLQKLAGDKMAGYFVHTKDMGLVILQAPPAKDLQ